jgi:predicted DNA repair protein MutK
MDDIGLSLASREAEASQRFGRFLVKGMPVLLKWLSIIGTAAMLWVGGHIILVGTHELGWDPLYDFVHGIEDSVHDIGGIGGILGWLINTAISAVIGLIVGGIVVAIISRLPIGSHGEDHQGQPAH